MYKDYASSLFPQRSALWNRLSTEWMIPQSLKNLTCSSFVSTVIILIHLYKLYRLLCKKYLDVLLVLVKVENHCKKVLTQWLPCRHIYFSFELAIQFNLCLQILYFHFKEKPPSVPHVTDHQTDILDHSLTSCSEFLSPLHHSFQIDAKYAIDSSIERSFGTWKQPTLSGFFKHSLPKMAVLVSQWTLTRIESFIRREKISSSNRTAIPHSTPNVLQPYLIVNTTTIHVAESGVVAHLLY